MSICFAMFVAPVRTVVWVAAAVAVGYILVLLQRRLRIFTRGTIAFMAVVVVVTAAVALFERSHDIRNTEDRTRRIAERYTALAALDIWCQNTFDAHKRITGGGKTQAVELAENLDAHTAALRQHFKQLYPNKLITAHCIAIDLERSPSRSITSFGPTVNEWNFTVVVDVREGNHIRPPPSIIIEGTIGTHSVGDGQWAPKNFTVDKSNFNSSIADTARQFLDSEFQSSGYSAHKDWSSNNRFGTQHVRYVWKKWSPTLPIEHFRSSATPQWKRR